MKKFEQFKLSKKEMSKVVGGGNYKCTEYKEDGSTEEHLYFNYGPLDLPNSAKCTEIKMNEVGLEG